MSKKEGFPDIIIGNMYIYTYAGGEKLIYTVTAITDTNYTVLYKSGVSHNILLGSNVHKLSVPVAPNSKDVTQQHVRVVKQLVREPRYIKQFTSPTSKFKLQQMAYQ